MAELQGREQVANFIRNSNKKKYRIWLAADDNKQVPRAVSSSSDPVSEFETWASMFSFSTNDYRITCYDSDFVEDDISKPGGDKKSGSVRATFNLNPVARAVNSPVAQSPAQQHQPLTMEAVMAAIGKQQPAVDVNAAIEAAIEKTAHKYQMTALNKQIEFMTQNFTQQLADMREEQIQAMEDEEEEERENKMATAMLEAEKVKMAGYENMMKIGAQVLGEVKTVVYEFMGKNPVGKLQGQQSMAVNGPSISANASTGYKLPVSDKPGELAIDYNTPANAEDQKAKVQTYAEKLYIESNDQLGNDLALIYKMSKDMPAKYEEVILNLRKLMGY